MRSADSSTPATTSQRRAIRTADLWPRLGLFARWLVGNVDACLYVLYVVTILALIALYFLNPPIERRQFYSQSAATWKTVASFIFGRGDSVRAELRGATSPPKTSIPAGQPVVGYLDQTENRPVISVRDSGTVRISGWAACSSPLAPAEKIEVLVAGQPKAVAVMSLPRPDVAAAFGRPDFASSGWQASFSATGLSVGATSLTARITCGDGQNGTLPPFQLIVSSK